MFEEQKNILLQHDYFLGVQLGKGSFGSVFLCTHLTTNQAFAVKILPLSSQLEDSPTRNRVLQEVEVMKRLNHPFLVRLHHVISSDHFLFLIMELVFGIDLFDQIASKKEKGGLEEDHVRFLFYQLCVALDYMHNELGIIHRDVKPENVLVCNQHHETVIKLVDFGLSKIHSATSTSSFVGTVRYIAPEVLTVGEEEKLRRSGGETSSLTPRTTYGFPADCYSAGIVLYVMMANSFPKFSDGVVLFKTKRVLSPGVQDLIRRLTAANPAERLTMKEALQHEWLISCKSRVERLLGATQKQLLPRNANSRKRVALVRSPSNENTTTAITKSNPPQPPPPSPSSLNRNNNGRNSWHLNNVWTRNSPHMFATTTTAAPSTVVAANEFALIESDFGEASNPSIRVNLKAIRNVMSSSERMLFKSTQTSGSALEVIRDIRSELQNPTLVVEKEYFECMLDMLKEWVEELKTSANEMLKSFATVIQSLNSEHDLSAQVAQMTLSDGAGERKNFSRFERMETFLHLQELFWAEIEATLSVLQQRAKIIAATIKYNPKYTLKNLVNKLEDYFSLWEEGAALLYAHAGSAVSTSPLKKAPGVLPASTVVVTNETSPVSPSTTTVTVTNETSPPPSHHVPDVLMHESPAANLEGRESSFFAPLETFVDDV